jgi:hypothetical protein
MSLPKTSPTLCYIVLQSTVGIVFLDFKKAFDTISHPLLLQKLQNLGIAGDIWLWIKDYLDERSISTIVNETK